MSAVPKPADDLSLFDAAAQVRAMIEAADDDGVLPEEFADLRALVERRTLSCVAYALEADKRAGYLRDAAAELMEKAKREERRGQRVRELIAEVMKASGITKLAHERGLFEARLYPGRDVAVEVDDGATFPPEFCREPPPLQPSKQKLREALERGEALQGVRLVRRDRLQIR
jgi:hypothetical protein